MSIYFKIENDSDFKHFVDFVKKEDAKLMLEVKLTKMFLMNELIRLGFSVTDNAIIGTNINFIFEKLAQEGIKKTSLQIIPLAPSGSNTFSVQMRN